MTRFTPLLLASLLLTACGGRSATTVKVPRAERPAPVASVAPVAAEKTSDATALVARVQAASNATRNYTAVAFTKMRGTDGKTDHNTASVAWRRPGQMAAEVMAAGNDKKTGTKLIYDGRDEVRVKTFFFGFIPLKLTLPVTDSRLVDSSKRSLKDTATEKLLHTILDPGSHVTILGDGEAVGEAVTMIEVHSPLSWKGVTKEVFGISKRLDLPIYRDAYGTDGKVMFHMEMRTMKVNVTIPSSTWTVD